MSDQTDRNQNREAALAGLKAIYGNRAPEYATILLKSGRVKVEYKNTDPRRN